MKLFLPIFAGSLLIVAAAPGIGGRLAAQTPATAPAAAPAPADAQAQPANFPKNPVKATPESQAKAKSLYAIDCAMCHGDNGNGKTDLAQSMSLTLVDWTDPATLANHPDGELFNIIRNGKGDKMPPEGEGRAKDDLVWNLVIYIRNFSKGHAAATAPAGAAPAPAVADSH
jgi:mono/diheme cytochrome c family protein